MKITYTLIILLFTTYSYPQDYAVEANDSFKSIDDFFIIPNDDGIHFTSVQIKNSTITAIEIDKNFETTKTLSIEIPLISSRVIYAREFVDNSYNLYYEGEEGVIILKFDFKKQKAFLDQVVFNKKKYSLLDIFEFENVIHILGIKKRSSELILHKIINNKAQKHIIPVDGYFTDYRGDGLNLYGLLTFPVYNGAASLPGIGLHFIEKDIPVSVNNGGQWSKAYLEGSTLRITLDDHPSVTYLINVDLNNFTAEVDVFGHARLDNLDLVTKTNSFFEKGKLYLLTSNADNMIIDVWNLKNRLRVHQITFNKNDKIFFKEPVLRNDIDSKKQLKYLKTSKVLSSTQSIKGFTINALDDENYVMHVNNVGPKDPKVVYSTSPALYGLYGSNEKRIFLDKNYNPLKNPLAPNVFDRFKIISEGYNFPQAVALSKVGDDYIYSIINLKNGEMFYFKDTY